LGDVHPIAGWVEPAHIELGRTRLELEAKADTGAATSSIHAFDIRPFTESGVAMVRFKVVQGTSQTEVELPVVRIGYVRLPEGDKEQRIYVRGTICLGSARWPILFSLNDRSQMRYPVLLGRAFLRAKYVVDSGKIHALGRPDCSLSEGGGKARETRHDHGRLGQEPPNEAASEGD
jgi:hypothetical protein